MVNISVLGVYMWFYICMNVPQYEKQYEHIMAQLVLESAYGSSMLATMHNNFGGMKANRDISGDYSYIYYVDSQGEMDKYYSLRSIPEYPELYFKFIGRKRYKGIEKTTTGEEFIHHLWVNGYSVDKQYETKIETIVHSGKFRELLGNIRRLINDRRIDMDWKSLGCGKCDSCSSGWMVEAIVEGRVRTPCTTD